MPLPRRWSVFLLLALFLSLASTAGANTLTGGGMHSALVKPDGSVWTWGANGSGQLGDGSTTDRGVPAMVPGITDAVAVSAGHLHTLVLRANGSLWAWGDNGFGQLGDGTTTPRSNPVAVVGLTNVVAIAAGRFHSAALTSDGALWTWGNNQEGQLGNGTTTQEDEPIAVLTGVSAISAGGWHTIALKNDGSVWGFGLNVDGQLGDGTSFQRNLPVQMQGITAAAAVAAGYAHTLILLGDGTVAAVGKNSNGQLGDDTQTVRFTPVPVSGLSSVTHITAGLESSYALRSDATVWAWGSNLSGRLGDGTLTPRHTPVQVLTGAVRIAAGDEHALALGTTSIMWAWGENGDGQLGDGTSINRHTPTSISGADYAWNVSTPEFSIGSGTYNTPIDVVISCATPGAQIHYTLNGDVPTQSDPTLASGASLTIDQAQTLTARAFKPGMPDSHATSAMYAFTVANLSFSPAAGTYTSAQSVSITTATPGATIRYTIDGSTPSQSSTVFASPIAINATTTLKAIAYRSTWSPSAIRTGTYTMNFGALAAPTLSPAGGTYVGSVTVTLSADALATIRYTTNGSTPTSSSTVYTGPIQLDTSVTIRAKAFHPDYATSAEGSASYTVVVPAPTLNVASGAHAPGTLVTIGTQDPAATLRITLTGVDPIATDAPIAAGTMLPVGDFTLKVRAFRTGASDSAVTTGVFSLTSAVGSGVIAAGGSHNLIATPGGLLYAWGQNTSGQVGIGSTVNRLTPALVQTLTGVVALAGGQSHSLAATVDGRVFAWGSNGSGQLGNDSTTNANRPVHIATLDDVIAVAAGTAHSLALTASGQVYAWGSGGSGRLGLGSTTSYDVPMLVPGLSDVVAIAAGATHSVAVTGSGQLYAWGANGSSQLGDGGTTSRLSPTLISGATDIVAVAAGTSHTLALRSNGEVLAWGAGNSGQLGLGTTNTRSTPTLVPGLSASAIAAGGTHSVALRMDGALVAWGANTSGQLGDGLTTQRNVPTTVSGPAAIVALSAGTSHTIAVTPAGDVWTWGAGNVGQLGDGGTAAARPVPETVFTAPGAWGVAAPTFSIPAGTYNTTLTVVVSSGTPEAVIRYTTSGGNPTESDPVLPANGEIAVDVSTTLRARAWVPGRAPSAVASAVYTLQPVSPMVEPVTGTYSAAQTVSLSTPTPSAVIRYTLDGSDPSAGSLLYGSPFAVDTSSVVKARAFRTDWASSTTSSATLTFNYGVLTMPVSSHGGGSYNQAQTVSLTAPAGATIRYTLDGSDPMESSSAYSAPLTIGESTTLRARAYKPDWTPSPILMEMYTLDVTPPTIVAKVWPTPTASGWNNTDVTVTFICADNSGPVSCPAPVVVTLDGAGQVVQRTVTDPAGNQASASVAINIDRMPPAVTIASPGDGTTSSATSVAVTGSVSDAASDIVSASCNGVVATVVDGQVSCTVALQPGRNWVVLHARDAAGNSASSGVSVQRSGISSSLRVDPGTRKLLINQRLPFTLIDQYGVVLASATWTSSDTSVAAVDANGIVTAAGAGQATITAAAQGIVTEATINVLPDASLPTGTVLWAATPAPGFSMQSPIYPLQVDETVPHVFTVESDGSNTTTVRALTESGSALWTGVAPGQPTYGDSFGGIVGEVLDESGNPRTLVRFGGPAAALPWRYESPGEISAGAQAPDGTIYTIEMLPGTAADGSSLLDRFVVVIDGRTGSIRARVPIPRDVTIENVESVYPDCQSQQNVWEFSPFSTIPIVGTDGNGYLQVRREARKIQSVCLETGQIISISKEVQRTLTLMRVQSSGAVTSKTLYEFDFNGADSACEWVARPGRTMPDGVGGIVATWDRYQTHGCQLFEQTATRIDANDVAVDHLLTTSEPQALDLVLIGDNSTAYLAAPDGSLTAVDVTMWAPKWSTTAVGSQATALEGGGIAVHNPSTGLMSAIDATGTTFKAATVPVSSADSVVSGIWRGLSTVTGAFVEVVGPQLNEALFSFSLQMTGAGGNRQGQNAPQLSLSASIAIDCRNVQGSLGILADHCYIVVRESLSVVSYIESGPIGSEPSPYGRNIASQYSPISDENKNAVWKVFGFRKRLTPEVFNCLRPAWETWNLGGHAYDPIGGNCNTFVSWLVHECNVPAGPSPFARAIGWIQY